MLEKNGIKLDGKGEETAILIEGKFHPIVAVKDLPREMGNELALWVAQQFPAMPHHAPHPRPLPKLFCKESYQTERACFFGGSFNPWHPGHLACLELCPEKNIIVVPDRNPWKKSSRPLNWNFFWWICNQLKDTNYSVYPGFVGREAFLPVAHWVKQTSFAKKTLLIGEDNFLLFEKWRDYSSLLRELAILYVVPRKGEEKERIKMAEKLGKHSPNTEIIFLPHHPYEDYSSSSIEGNGIV